MFSKFSFAQKGALNKDAARLRFLMSGFVDAAAVVATYTDGPDPFSGSGSNVPKLQLIHLLPSPLTPVWFVRLSR